MCQAAFLNKESVQLSQLLDFISRSIIFHPQNQQRFSYSSRNYLSADRSLNSRLTEATQSQIHLYPQDSTQYEASQLPQISSQEILDVRPAAFRAQGAHLEDSFFHHPQRRHHHRASRINPTSTCNKISEKEGWPFPGWEHRHPQVFKNWLKMTL